MPHTTIKNNCGSEKEQPKNNWKLATSVSEISVTVHSKVKCFRKSET
jgi:phenylpyruvate tautomerase PptA (4-oxalocrotonate tautomerase family)